MNYLCKKCNIIKSEQEFYKDKTRNYGTYPCKTCVKDSRKSYYKKNSVAIKETVAKYREANRPQLREKIKEDRKLNPERYKNYDRKSYVKNSESKKLNARKYYKENVEHYKKVKTEYYNENKDKIKAQSKIYREQNPELCRKWGRLSRAKRRAVIRNALPKWANLEKIKEIYNNCPKGYHVDHIIPLQGKNVCGLHVEYNLQYLTKEENLSKGNKC